MTEEGQQRSRMIRLLIKVSGSLLTDQLKQIKETFGQFLTGLPGSS